MEKPKKLKRILKIIIIAVLAVIVALTALLYIKTPFAGHWKSKDVLSSPITKITLKSLPEYLFDGWVEFSDEDLIQKWTDYFNSIDLQHNVGLDVSAVDDACFPKNGGFRNHVTVYTENSVLTLTFYDSNTLQFGNSLRRFNVTGGEYPFDETYKAAKERYGLVKN